MTTNYSNAVSVIQGPINRAQRIGIYGPEGVGKTTLGSEFPSPVFIDTESGSDHLNIDRFPQPKDWDDVEIIINYLLSQKHDYKTVIIDTVDWLEKLLVAHVCKENNKDNIEEFGYGKGYTLLADAFAKFLSKLERLRSEGIHVVLIAHSTIKKFEQPDAAGAYDRYELKLSRTVSPLVKEWVDMLLFCNYETKIVESDGKRKAIGGRDRVIHTTHSAAWDAKNRHSLAEKLPFGFKSFADILKVSDEKKSVEEFKPKGPVPKDKVEKIERYWRALEKTDADKIKAFQWLGSDAIEGDEDWAELTEAQADKLIAKLQDLMNKEAERGGDNS